MQKISFNSKGHIPQPEDKFPSERHYMAYQIASYFGENYSTWVLYIRDTYLWVGQIQYEFNRIKATKFDSNGQAIGKKDKVKLLMKKLFPKR